MNTFSDIIDLWPTVAEFAADLDVPYPTAAAMRQRNSVAPEYWRPMIDAARRRGFRRVNADLLTEIAAKKARHRKPLPAAE